MSKLQNRNKRNNIILQQYKKSLTATALLGDIEDDKQAVKLMTQVLKRIGTATAV